MGININTTELKRLLDMMPAEQNIMLVGKHGIGKSEILTKYFEVKGMKVVALFLGQMSDPGDLIGLPRKDEETGKTTFMPPYWFPTDGKPVVLFLDELNRARPEVLQTIMDLALNRKLAGRSLPEGSRLISAVNDGEEYQLTDLDPALVSRFNIYTFRPSTEEWLLWATNNKLDKRVIEFIGEESGWLDGNNGMTVQMDAGLEKTPDRRGWKKVSDAIKDIATLDSFDQKAIAGIIGVKASAAFIAFIKNRQMITGKDVLADFEKCEKDLKTYAVHQLSQVNESIYRYIETEEKLNKKKVAENLQLYVNFITENNREAMAHFTSVIEKKLYAKATLFISQETPKVYKQMISFIMSL